MRRLVPALVLGLVLAGCATPRAEVQDAVADVTDAANSGDAAATQAAVTDLVTLVEQRRAELGADEANRLVAAARAVAAAAEGLEQVEPSPTPSPTPSPRPEPVRTTQPPEPTPEPTTEPPATRSPTPSPEPQEEPTEAPTPEPTEDGEGEGGEDGEDGEDGRSPTPAQDAAPTPPATAGAGSPTAAALLVGATPVTSAEAP